MMHFTNPSIDGPCLAELREVGVLTPDVIERIDESIGRPETGTLNEFLLVGTDLIPEGAWLTWLIRRHGCHRFGRVQWHRDTAMWAKEASPAEGNLPYRSCADGVLLVAVLRPDVMPMTIQRWPTVRLHGAAATLRELRELHQHWPQAN